MTTGLFLLGAGSGPAGNVLVQLIPLSLDEIGSTPNDLTWGSSFEPLGNSQAGEVLLDRIEFAFDPTPAFSLDLSKDALHSLISSLEVDSRSLLMSRTAFTTFGSTRARNAAGTDDFVAFCQPVDGTNANTMGILIPKFNGSGVSQGVISLDLIPTIQFQDQAIQRTSVAADRNGNLTVVYCEFDDMNFQPEVRARRFDASGNPIGGEIEIPGVGKASPDVAVLDADGNRLIVTYANFGAGTIGGNIVDLNGANPVVGSDIPVNSSTGSFVDLYPSVAVNPATSEFTVVWERASGDFNNQADVVGRRFNADGSPVEDEFVVNEATPGLQGQPDVAYGPGGLVAVVWAGDSISGPSTNDLDIFLRAYLPGGAPVGGQTVVNTDLAERQDWPQVRFLPDLDNQGRSQFAVCFRDTGVDDLGDDIIVPNDEPRGTGTKIRCYAVDGTIPNLDDLDLDGLTLDEEGDLGTDPNNPDSDFDGVTDGNEVWAGYDALDPTDTFRIERVTVDQNGGTVSLLLPRAKVGKTYSLYQWNPATQGFEPVAGQQQRPGTGADLIFTDGFESGNTSVWSVQSP